MTTILILFAVLALLTIALPKVDQAATVMRKSSARSGYGSYIMADGVAFYVGQLVQLESGYANHWDETGRFLGVMIGGDSRLNDGVFFGETSDVPPPEARIDESGATIMHTAVGGTPTQADVGALVYCPDSNLANLTKTDTTNPPVGWLKRFRSTTDCDVQLFTPAEWMAGDAGASWAS